MPVPAFPPELWVFLSPWMLIGAGCLLGLVVTLLAIARDVLASAWRALARSR